MSLYKFQIKLNQLFGRFKRRWLLVYKYVKLNDKENYSIVYNTVINFRQKIDKTIVIANYTDSINAYWVEIAWFEIILTGTDVLDLLWLVPSAIFLRSKLQQEMHMLHATGMQTMAWKNR